MLEPPAVCALSFRVESSTDDGGRGGFGKIFLKFFRANPNDAGAVEAGPIPACRSQGCGRRVESTVLRQGCSGFWSGFSPS